VQGCAGRSPAQVAALADQIRAGLTLAMPFGLNLLLFLAAPDAVDAVLAARPPVFSTAWPNADFDLRSCSRVPKTKVRG
jgi:hypothetical protein